MGTTTASVDPAYLEGLYERWKQDPASLDPSWQWFFQGFDLASCPRACESGERAAVQSRVADLIDAYRELGHRLAWLDPLSNPSARAFGGLALDRFGLSEGDLDRVFDTHGLPFGNQATLRKIVQELESAYAGTIGAEIAHISDRAPRRWLEEQLEAPRPRRSPEERQVILEQLLDAELFETFLHRRYRGQKRFSVEGSETLIPLLHAIIELAPALGVRDVILGMSHRGRLNVLANILDKSYATIFAEFEDNFLPNSVAGDGDVKYHKGFSSIHESRSGLAIELSLTANPSHLEAVCPVVLGRAFARIRQAGRGPTRVLSIIVHGDAAFAGQGMVAETLNLSRLPGYDVGGTIHVIVNNQIGFTTPPEQARSTRYATDVAKMVEAPVFHLNGDDPETAVFAAEIALRYRQEFGRDAVVDMVCYRRHGHSEVDEPAFTHPDLYRRIEAHPTVRKLYTARLQAEGVLDAGGEAALARRFEERLEAAYHQAKEGKPDLEPDCCELFWRELDPAWSFDPGETGVARDDLLAISEALAAVPEGFRIHPKLERLRSDREKAVREGGPIDWSLAEALAFGSLLREGASVRLSGQDSERGTFSQRHAAWFDQETGARHAPLEALRGANGATFEVHNSPLSEASVLGFEYGCSLTEPHMLILWEAQFGDFANGAQVIIDQFLVSARSKWQRDSGLVLLLPHGYEGQGPEHSNAYVERYLQASAEENLQVCIPTAPAQYFHLLRRQLRRRFRRPLAVFTPKSLLRHPQVVSTVDELVGGRFQEVLPDPSPPAEIRRIVLCAGKVAVELLEARARAPEPVAVVRLEQLYPLHAARLSEVLGALPAGAELCWVQEEPENRGAWSTIAPRLRALFPDRPVTYIGRRPSASGATGSLRQHRLEQAAILSRALEVTT